MSSNRNKSGPHQHQWTEYQTKRLLEVINSSQTYIDVFFPSPTKSKQNDLVNKEELEKELCLLILDNTKWIRWMINNNKILTTRDNKFEMTKYWDEIDNPVEIKLVSIHKDAREIRRKFGSAVCEEELGNYEKIIWNEFQNLDKFTWYFLYVQAQLVHNSNWINAIDSTSSTSETESENSPITPEAGPSRIRIRDDDHSHGATTTRSQSDLPLFPQSSILDRPLPTPRSTSGPSRPASTSRPAPRSLDNRHIKRRRISQNTLNQGANLAARIGEREPPIIDIPSDSDDEMPTRLPIKSKQVIIIDDDDDEDDHDDIIIIGSRHVSPSPNTTFMPIPIRSRRDAIPRPTFNQVDNLEAIRRMSGSFMNTPQNDGSDSGDESDTSTRSSTPLPRLSTPLPRAISPHFIPNMFFDPNIRSHRLDLLHRNLGLPVLSSEQPPELGPALTLISCDDDNEEYDNRDEIVYSPLVISDGTLEDFPLVIESSSPVTTGFRRDIPVEISDEEDVKQTFSNHPMTLSLSGFEDSLVIMADEDTSNADMNGMGVTYEEPSHTEVNLENEVQQLNQDFDTWVMVNKPLDSSFTSLRLTLDPPRSALPSSTLPTTLDSSSLIIRMLLSELRHTTSHALSDIEVVLPIEPSPSKKALAEIVQLMDGQIVDSNEEQVGRKIRYLVQNSSSSITQSGSSREVRVTMMELMSIIADLREKELQ